MNTDTTSDDRRKIIKTDILKLIESRDKKSIDIPFFNKISYYKLNKISWFKGF